MIEAFSVSNFTCLPNLTTKFVSGVNVFFGDNNSGKTHLLKLLYSLSKPVHPQRGDPKSRVSQNLLSAFQLSNMGGLVKRGSKGATPKISLNDDLVLEIKMGKFKKFHVPFDGDQTPIFIPTQNWAGMRSWIMENLKGGFEHEFDGTCLDFIKALDKKAVRIDLGLQGIENYLTAALGGRIVFSDGCGELRFNSPNGGHLVPFLSESKRRLASLCHLISNGSLNQKSILFWDNPEVGLDIKNLKLLTQVLLDLSNCGIQIFISTHSPFLLRELDLLLAGEEYETLPRKWFHFRLNELGGTKIQSSLDLNKIKDVQILDDDWEQASSYFD